LLESIEADSEGKDELPVIVDTSPQDRRILHQEIEIFEVGEKKEIQSDPRGENFLLVRAPRTKQLAQTKVDENSGEKKVQIFQFPAGIENQRGHKQKNI
jgi:hypothetical protein